MIVDLIKDSEHTINVAMGFGSREDDFEIEIFLLGKIMFYDAMVGEVLRKYSTKITGYPLIRAGKDYFKGIEEYENANNVIVFDEEIKKEYLKLNEDRGVIFHTQAIHYLFYKNYDEDEIGWMHDYLLDYFKELSSFLIKIEKLYG